MIPRDPRDPIAIVAESPSLSREIAELRELKAAVEAGRRAFYTRLRACEERGGWRALAPTFALFLGKTKLGTVSEYAAACRALDIIPADTIDTIGMSAATVVADLPETSRPAALADLTEAAKKTGLLTGGGAKALIRKHLPPAPPAVEPKPAPGVSEPSEFVLRAPSRETSALASALQARLGDEECRSLILALDAKVNRI